MNKKLFIIPMVFSFAACVQLKDIVDKGLNGINSITETESNEQKINLQEASSEEIRELFRDVMLKSCDDIDCKCKTNYTANNLSETDLKDVANIFQKAIETNKTPKFNNFWNKASIQAISKKAEEKCFNPNSPKKEEKPVDYDEFRKEMRTAFVPTCGGDFKCICQTNYIITHVSDEDLDHLMYLMKTVDDDDVIDEWNKKFSVKKVKKEAEKIC